MSAEFQLLELVMFMQYCYWNHCIQQFQKTAHSKGSPGGLSCTEEMKSMENEHGSIVSVAFW